LSKNRKDKKQKREDVQILGPEDLAHLDVDEVLDLVDKKALKKNKEKKKTQKPDKFEHYYTKNPTSELTTKILNLKLKNDHEYTFEAPSGVYGKKRVDRATIALIENMEMDGRRILDIGCGYGVIGITIKKEFPTTEVFMSDINKRAVDYAGKNAKDNNADIEIRHGYLFEPWEEEKFDMIVSNPPIVAGKEVWMKLVEQSKDHLNENGTLQLVAFHNKGGKRIMEYMKEIFGNSKVIAKDGGVRLYKSVKED
jgi:16S rRNA G1207 methylase RsmC